MMETIMLVTDEATLEIQKQDTIVLLALQIYALGYEEQVLLMNLLLENEMIETKFLATVVVPTEFQSRDMFERGK
jgi:hypothetical protein